jgi:hypothetical protein
MKRRTLSMTTNPDMWKKLEAFDLFIESVMKPDDELRTEARLRGCLDELLEIREDMIYNLREERKKIVGW